MALLIDEAGNRFGKWTVIERGNNRGNVATWLCRCECGTEREVPGTRLRKNTSKSCGCQHYQKLAYGEAAFNRLFLSYQRNAKSDGRNWSLSEETFRDLTSRPCYYCGIPPFQYTERKDTNGYYLYNGLDRVDNGGGYSKDNVVSCCFVCNRAKHSLTQAEFLEWLRRVYEHQDTHSELWG